MKKLCAVLLCLSLLAGMLSGCNTKPESQTSSQPVETTSNTEVNTGYPIVDEKITVKCLVQGTMPDNERLLWKKLEELTNIKVEFTVVENEQMATFMAAGEWPDFFHKSLASNYINDYGVLGNKLVDYNTILDIMPNLQKCFEDYPGSQKVAIETNGAMYQLPAYEASVTVNASRFYFRGDNLKKNNLEVPKTIDEFYDTLVALKNATGDAPLVVGSIGGRFWLEDFLFASFGDLQDAEFDSNKDGKVVFSRVSEQYKRYLSFMNKLYSEGLLHKEYLTMDPATKDSLAKEGKSTFIDGSAHNLTEADFADGVIDIGVPRPFLSEWNDNTIVRGKSPANIGGPNLLGGFAINAESPYVNEIARLIDIAYASEEVAEGTGLYGQAFCYGPENLTWEFSKEDKSEYAFILPEDKKDISFTQYQYDWVIYANAGRQDALATAITSTPGNNQVRQIQFRDNLNPYSNSNPFPRTFLKFTVEEQEVLDNKFLEINTYCREMNAKFISGVADIDKEWDSYIAKIEQMGLADVLKVYQSSYDRWNEL